MSRVDTPHRVKNLKVTDMKETEVTITWSKPDDGAPPVKAYLIERQNAKGVWEKVAEAS